MRSYQMHSGLREGSASKVCYNTHMRAKKASSTEMPPRLGQVSKEDLPHGWAARDGQGCMPALRTAVSASSRSMDRWTDEAGPALGKRLLVLRTLEGETKTWSVQGPPPLLLLPPFGPQRCRGHLPISPCQLTAELPPPEVLTTLPPTPARPRGRPQPTLPDRPVHGI